MEFELAFKSQVCSSAWEDEHRMFREKAIDVTRKLSYKYTQDTDYIENEIRLYSSGLLCFALVPEHMTGKLVNES